MSEPLDEETEVAWLSFLDGFEREIYPLLFKERGYTRGEALTVWRLHQLNGTIEELTEEMRQ